MTDRQYSPRPKVLYIGGTGRTGSTLLTRLLGEIPGWFPGGELAFLWRYGFLEGGLCSCGRRLMRCDLWSRVFARVESGGVELDAQRLVELRRRCWSLHLPLMIHRRLAQRMLDRLEEFPSVVAEVYRALAATTASSVIIDSSKEPHYSWILRERTDLDVYFLHLVRDPRAVAHSWRRVRTERGLDGPVTMERRRVLKAALYYDVSNVAGEAIWGGRPDRYRFVRYEDFVADPDGAVASISAFVGSGPVVSPLRDGSFRPTEQHVAWGNPTRFAGGTVTVRPDSEWRRAAGPLRSGVMFAATAPLALRYGYPGRSSGALRGPSGRLRDTMLGRPTTGGGTFRDGR